MIARNDSFKLIQNSCIYISYIFCKAGHSLMSVGIPKPCHLVAGLSAFDSHSVGGEMLSYFKTMGRCITFFKIIGISLQYVVAGPILILALFNRRSFLKFINSLICKRLEATSYFCWSRIRRHCRHPYRAKFLICVIAHFLCPFSDTSCIFW